MQCHSFEKRMGVSIILIFLEEKWLDPEFHDNETIKKPDELENEMEDPPGVIDEKLLDRIQGSIIGMALGDALGAHVEFRPRQYLKDHPVTDLEGGGTWGLLKGQVLFLDCSLYSLKSSSELKTLFVSVVIFVILAKLIYIQL